MQHTEFDPTVNNETSIYDLEDPAVNAGAWLFEAASNYLENSNAVQSEDDQVNFSIIINKQATCEMEGTDLVAKFNAFISNLESYHATEGYVRKVVDVRIGIENTDQIQLLANVTFGVQGIGNYAFPTSDVTFQDAAQIYLTNSVSENAKQLNVGYNLVFNTNGTISTNSIFLSSVTSVDPWLYNDINGSNFYFSPASNLYSATLFQDEHNRIYLKLLNFCSTNNIPTNKLWSVMISPDSINTGGATYGVHRISQIKIADINVM